MPALDRCRADSPVWRRRDGDVVAVPVHRVADPDGPTVTLRQQPELEISAVILEGMHNGFATLRLALQFQGGRHGRLRQRGEEKQRRHFDS